MIVVVFYNLSGFLVALGGLALGLLMTVATGLLSVGAISTSIVWIAGGLLWRMKTPPRPDGRKTAWPSVMFVPMPIWGALFLFIGGALGAVIDITARNHAADPRRNLLLADERHLRKGGMTGDSGAAAAVELGVLSADYAVKPLDASAFVGVNGDAVIVLVKIPNLSELASADMVKAMDTAEAALNTFKDLATKKKYIGLKGKLLFGACRGPGGRPTVGPSEVEPLLDYYGPAPAKPAAPPAP